MQQTETPFPNLESQIRAYDRQIFLELVKLAEFNVRYQQNVNHYARWRKIIYPLAQESVYGCLLAFSITDMSQRYRGWDNPGKISPTSTKVALEGAMVGTLIGGTSSMIELAANGVEEWKARRLGYSNAKAVSSVRSKVKLIDEALASRSALMRQIDRNCASWELLKLKEELLHYERERLLFEFKRWNAHSRGVAWNKNTFYIVNSAVNFSRFSAITLGLKSFTAPRASGAIGPVLSTAASLAGLGPAASSVAGNWVQRRQERSLEKLLPSKAPLTDAEAKQKFDRLTELLESDESKAQNLRVAKELIHLRQEKLALDTLIFSEEKNIERFRLVAGQQALIAPPVSSMGLASAILSTVGYHGFRNQPIINNRLSFTGDAIVIPAESIALIATPAAAIRTYMYEKNLSKKNEHPDQLLSKRLKDLEELEATVTEAWR
ncbi:MAG: hypothetical protein SFV17_04000 [Candidatus Obscuribacter sp.]|nr:hypothetical protein [Candidatus Obscuribacter sp.]